MLLFLPASGGTQRLSRIVGPSKAKELIFTGRVMDGEEAHDIGAVNQVVDQNDAGDAAYAAALKLAEQIIPNVSHLTLCVCVFLSLSLSLSVCVCVCVN